MNRKLELAIMNINMKYSYLLGEYGGDQDKAIAVLREDINKFHEMFGLRIMLDDNYSNTWGINPYGIYKSFDEFLEISEIWEV